MDTFMSRLPILCATALSFASAVGYEPSRFSIGLSGYIKTFLQAVGWFLAAAETFLLRVVEIGDVALSFDISSFSKIITFIQATWSSLLRENIKTRGVVLRISREETRHGEPVVLFTTFVDIERMKFGKSFELSALTLLYKY